jgi:hypothetical protein
MKIKFLDKGDELLGGWFIVFLGICILSLSIFGFEYFPIKQNSVEINWGGRFILGFFIPTASIIFLVYYFVFSDKNKGT